MLGIILYCIGIMYTPGPVNILSLNSGIQRKARSHVPFCAGVSGALFFWFMFIGYVGTAIITESFMPVIASAGSCFIIYLAIKILRADVEPDQSSTDKTSLGFRDGLLMQLLNPKSLLAVLPVTTIQFPAAGITGGQIALWSASLAILGFGAPFSYALFGSILTRRVSKSRTFETLNLIMGLLLLAVAIDMAYEHVYLVLCPPTL